MIYFYILIFGIFIFNFLFLDSSDKFLCLLHWILHVESNESGPPHSNPTKGLESTRRSTCSASASCTVKPAWRLHRAPFPTLKIVLFPFSEKQPRLSEKLMAECTSVSWGFIICVVFLDSTSKKEKLHLYKLKKCSL